jgi:hypothetical protein
VLIRAGEAIVPGIGAALRARPVAEAG